MPVLTDLREIKALLDINANDSSQDKKLGFIIEHATSWIEELLNRKLFYQSRTEYYGGTGTQNLLLKSRPVFTTPTIQVNVDGNGNWGAASGSFATNTALTYGTDFVLKLDQDDGTSRSGILVRINGGSWPRPFYRELGYLSSFVGPGNGNIKVIYTAGYTLDTLPGALRSAAGLLVARLNNTWPLGMELGSESYEERSVSYITDQKAKLLTLVRPMIMGNYRNWSF